MRTALESNRRALRELRIGTSKEQRNLSSELLRPPLDILEVSPDGIGFGLERETVRTHLKHVFAKVGTTRQADLVRLLLTGAAGVRWE